MQKSTHLKYIKSFNLCEDVSLLPEKGVFPFVNIDGESKGYADIDGFHQDVAERKTYKIIFQFATKHAEAQTAVLGKTDFKGIWELQNDIYDTIKDYIAENKFNSTSISMYKKPVVFQRTWVMSDKRYMAGAELSVEVYQDIFQ